MEVTVAEDLEVEVEEITFQVVVQTIVTTSTTTTTATAAAAATTTTTTHQTVITWTGIHKYSSKCNYNNIKNNLMRTTNSNSPGPAFGIVDQQGTSTYYYAANNNTFEGNKIENFYYYGVFNRYSNGEQFVNNDISRKNASSGSTTSTTMFGMYCYYTYGTNRSTSYNIEMWL